MTIKKLGKILPKDALIMRYAVCDLGTKENPEQFSFDLANFHSPMITSQKTGKRFVLSLNEFIAMAIEAGIEDED